MKKKILIISSISFIIAFTGNNACAQNAEKVKEPSTALKKANPEVKSDTASVRTQATWQKTRNPNYNSNSKILTTVENATEKKAVNPDKNKKTLNSVY